MNSVEFHTFLVMKQLCSLSSFAITRWHFYTSHQARCFIAFLLQWLLVNSLQTLAAPACTFCVQIHLRWTFFAVQWNEEESAGRKENGYLYLLAPELRSQIPRGSLTQCSTNWCSWRSDRAICSAGEGDMLHLSAYRVLIQRLLYLRLFQHQLSYISFGLLSNIWHLTADCSFPLSMTGAVTIL